MFSSNESSSDSAKKKESGIVKSSGVIRGYIDLGEAQCCFGGLSVVKSSFRPDQTLQLQFIFPFFYLLAFQLNSLNALNCINFVAKQKS